MISSPPAAVTSSREGPRGNAGQRRAGDTEVPRAGGLGRTGPARSADLAGPVVHFAVYALALPAAATSGLLSDASMLSLVKSS